MVLITGANKSIALYKAIEEGVCHMWTVSAFQQHSNTLMVCDEVRTLHWGSRRVTLLCWRPLDPIRALKKT